MMGLSPLKAVAFMNVKRTLRLSTMAPLLHDTETGFDCVQTPVVWQIKQWMRIELAKTYITLY